MKPNGLIVLLTDFGHRDTYVGVMKGALASLSPEARVIDLCHEVSPQDIVGGGVLLASSLRYFPTGTVFVVIVDPGVGSDRRPILGKGQRHFYIGPDNGVLSQALHLEHVERVYLLQNKDFQLGPVSPTFHGRDIFAPAAAWLTKGIPPEKFGPALDSWIHADPPSPTLMKDGFGGMILRIDHFGNCMTTLRRYSILRRCRQLAWERNLPCKNKKPFIYSLSLKGPAFEIGEVSGTYAELPWGEPGLLYGSSGFLEIAVNGGSARDHFRLKVGDPVELSITLPEE